MGKFYNAILPLIKPARVATASEALGEPKAKIEAAFDVILADLLGRLAKKRANHEVEEVLKEAQKLKIYENYDLIWEGHGIDTHKNIGERMENRLIGTENQTFVHHVAAKSGMKPENVDRLTNWVAATIAAWFAGQMASGKSYTSLIDALHLEYPSVHKPAAKKSTRREGDVIEVVPKKKCGLCWLWWLLGILLLALIVFFCWRSCSKKESAPVVETVTEVRTVHKAPEYTQKTVILPDNTRATMYGGNLEAAVEAFLKSDKFKNATDAELRSVWFEFTDIDFEHNSATNLMAGGEKQLATLAAILKKYPDVKIKIGAFADKTGTRAVNYAISEGRARNIEAALAKAGVAATRVTTEGFGERYADIDEKASDAARAPDRDIAMRFTK